MKVELVALSFLFLLTFGAVNSQPIATKKIVTEVTEAIVYLDGAEVRRNQQISLVKGKNLLIFENLSPKINPKTIQVNLEKGVDILSITSRIDYLSNDESNPDIKKMKDSVELLNRKITDLNNEKGAYYLEKEMLIANKSIGGQQNGVSITDLKTASDFFRLRLTDINNRTSEIDRQIAEYNAVLRKLNQQLSEANSKASVRKGEISVLLTSDMSRSLPIELKYLVNEVGWIPSYDIKATEISEPIQLIYRAKVYNNSEVDWKDVNITLSSADPTSSASKPVFEPWFLSYKTANSALSNAYESGAVNGQIRGSRSSASQTFIDGVKTQNAPPQSMMEIGGANSGAPSPGQGIFQKGDLTFTNIAISDVSAEFKIKEKYSIPSDAKPYFIEVTQYQLQASYKHFSIPKQNCDVFLLARVTGWEKLDILEGTANIYLNGTYTGQSFINTRDVNDTLDISLGRDNKVQINRKKLSEYSKEKLIGSNVKESFGYEIVVKNNHKVPISIEVLDQLPVPQDSDIEVDDIELSGGQHNELSGEVKWKLNIASSETKSMKLSFAIKYPKGRPIDTKTRKYRSVRWM